MDDIWGEYETSYDTYTDTYSDYTHTEYQWGMEAQQNLWDASVDAYVSGDSYLAYELNVASLEAGAYGDEAWDTWNTIDTSSYADTSAYSSYDATSSYDASSSYSSSYDTSSSYSSSYDAAE